MLDPIKSIASGITEGIISGTKNDARIEHASNEDGMMTISGDYSSLTKHTGIHLTGGAQITISGNARIIQQD